MPGRYVSIADLPQAECAGPAKASRTRTYVQMAHDAALVRRALADDRRAAACARREAETEDATDPAYTALESLLAANDDRPLSAPNTSRRLVTKAPGRQLRRSGVRQSADAQKMRAHAKAEKPEAVDEREPSASTSTSSNTSSTKPTTTSPTHRPRDLAAWKESGELPRLIACNRALTKFGTPYAFSLNLHPSLIRAANENARGFLDFVRRRVALVLKRELGRTVEAWSEVETDDEGRPHLHGGLTLTDSETPAVMERALAKAGGNWTRQGSRCADVRIQHDPDGWVAYCLKRTARTRRHLRLAAGLDPKAPIALSTVTAVLRALGERLHGEIRSTLKMPRHSPAAPEATPVAPEPMPAAGESLRRSEGHPVAGSAHDRMDLTGPYDRPSESDLKFPNID